MKTISWLLRTELGGTLFIWLFQPVLSSLFSWLRKNSLRAVSFGWWIRMCGAFPIDRENPGQEANQVPC